MILSLILLAAQVPVPLGQTVILTWTPAICGVINSVPTVCGAFPNSGYFVSRLTVTSGAKVCPPPAASNYTPMNYGNLAIVARFVDQTATKEKVCYVVQTTAGGVTTAPSAPVGPFVVP